jgi:hypothetical protein
MDGYLEARHGLPGLCRPGRIPLVDGYSIAMEAGLQGLETVAGDISDGQQRFQAALAATELESPIGPIRLDERRQGIGRNYLFTLEPGADGKLAWMPLRSVENVEQTFNGYFAPGDPPPGQETIECRSSDPPPWTRAAGG